MTPRQEQKKGSREPSLNREQNTEQPSPILVTQASRAIGIMGGTFDPIHYGHLVVAEEVYSTLHLSEVLFIPAARPPHKSGHPITEAHHRVTMLEIALATNAHFHISSIELEREGLSYTVDTLYMLREQLGMDIALLFIIGWDSLEEFHTWHQAADILTLLTRLVVVRRPGYVDDSEYNNVLEQRLPGILQKLLIVPVPQLEISATDLRRRVSEGRPIKYQTPEAVETYINENRLYSHAYRESKDEKH